MTPETYSDSRRTFRQMQASDDDAPIWREPPWLEGLNDLGEVLEGIQIALDRPERFTTEQLQALAREVQDAARRHGVYEPLD
jgi:hypothetical protein